MRNIIRGEDGNWRKINLWIYFNERKKKEKNVSSQSVEPLKTFILLLAKFSSVRTLLCKRYFNFSIINCRESKKEKDYRKRSQFYFLNFRINFFEKIISKLIKEEKEYYCSKLS